MSMKGHTTEQNMTTVEDGHNKAYDGEAHNENRREIQMQQHSKLINLLEAEHIPQIFFFSSGHEDQHSRLFTKYLDGLRTRALAKKLGLRSLDMADGGTNVDVADGGTNGNDR